MQVRSQITAAGQPAHELRGSSLALLQQEVQRLCPNGAVVLRQSQTKQLNEREPSFVQRWTVEWADPPRNDAQLHVVCSA